MPSRTNFTPAYFNSLFQLVIYITPVSGDLGFIAWGAKNSGAPVPGAAARQK